MDCIELSLKDIKEKSNSWAKEIIKSYEPQLLIYVAKAGYIIAEGMNAVFNVDILGIGATRKGNKFKEKIAFLFRHIPKFIHKLLISIELKSNVHGKDANREVRFHEKINTIDPNSISRLLVIDDSVDTGYSMKSVVEEVQKYFTHAEIKLASLNVWRKSEKVISVDYALYYDTIIKAPMSKDSKEYKEFIKIYNSATNNGKI